ncbi:MAG: aminotransferase class I/II-fold pyridoxal phosphate-dependent enzyme, partial [Planctomycetota bacterium]|nr:aminotransferase class I/II-fold pyridoxal phosphate-dependent enzyme [Planctomycetota bacterium]
MAIKLSRTVCSIAESATLAIDAAAKAMKKAGRDVVNLSAGEPDFDTPSDIRKAATAAMESGFTRYCPAGGIPDLREAIVEKLRKDNGLEYAPDCVAVTNGAKQAIYLALQSILDPGDRVLVQAPYWVSYSEMVKSLGGVPVCLPAKYADGFAFDVNQVVKRITPRTKALILNSPNNPTGAVLPQETLAQLEEALFKRKAGGGKAGKKKPIAGMCIISDEIYEKLVYAPM